MYSYPPFGRGSGRGCANWASAQDPPAGLWDGDGGVPGQCRRDRVARCRNGRGSELKGLKVLDVGCGQQLKLARYFALRQNDVTGIDYNAVPLGFDPRGYWKLARSNGPVRVIKTLGRKVLGVDARFSRDLLRTLAGP